MLTLFNFQRLCTLFSFADDTSVTASWLDVVKDIVNTRLLWLTTNYGTGLLVRCLAKASTKGELSPLFFAYSEMEKPSVVGSCPIFECQAFLRSLLQERSCLRLSLFYLFSILSYGRTTLSLVHRSDQIRQCLNFALYALGLIDCFSALTL